MNEKILVIDDINFNIVILTNILEKEGFRVFSVNNGLSILEITHRFKPDVILLDIIMPIMDGFEVCKLLKSNYELKDIPVIMVTARTEGTDIKKALEIGAFDYVKKPFDEIEIIARIKSALRLKNLQDELKELATKDGLTGLYNYTLLVELSEKEIAKQQRSNMDISFAMIDIDFFKKINDTYGHIFGNSVLKGLSNILVNSVRKGDIVARYGGDEFCLVLPETNIQDAFQLCERIRKKIETLNFNIGNETVKITGSMGVFLKDYRNNIDLSEIIQKVDKNLYKAKNNGRNRVEI
jgi:two-component system, cell cycle response regulator